MLIHQRIPATGVFVAEGTSILGSEIRVEFVQLGSGSTFLYCGQNESGAAPLMIFFGRSISFQGRTGNGLPLKTSSLRSCVGVSGDQRCFSLSHVTIGDSALSCTRFELMLTNLEFDEDDGESRSLNVTVGNAEVPVVLRPASPRSELLLHLRQTHFPTVTATVDLDITGMSGDSVDILVDDICTALSVIKGTKIQWIQKAGYVGAEMVWAEFGETITKDFISGLLCFDPMKRKGIRVSVDRLRDVFPRVRAFRENYDSVQSIVKSWLDARVEGDFLNARTLKYAVVLESVCRIVEAKHDDLPTTHVPKAAWRAAGKEFLPRIKEHLLEKFQIDEQQVEGVCNPSSWGNQNRSSFRNLLTASLQRLGLRMDDQVDRIRVVVAVRNKIVHSMTYMEPEEFDELNCPVLDTNQQHFLLARFVEEALLRLFGVGDVCPMETTNLRKGATPSQGS